MKGRMLRAFYKLFRLKNFHWVSPWLFCAQKQNCTQPSHKLLPFCRWNVIVHACKQFKAEFSSVHASFLPTALPLPQLSLRIVLKSNKGPIQRTKETFLWLCKHKIHNLTLLWRSLSFINERCKRKVHGNERWWKIENYYAFQQVVEKHLIQYVNWLWHRK